MIKYCCYQNSQANFEYIDFTSIDQFNLKKERRYIYWIHLKCRKFLLLSISHLSPVKPGMQTQYRIALHNCWCNLKCCKYLKPRKLWIRMTLIELRKANPWCCSLLVYTVYQKWLSISLGIWPIFWHAVQIIRDSKTFLVEKGKESWLCIIYQINKTITHEVMLWYFNSSRKYQALNLFEKK